MSYPFGQAPLKEIDAALGRVLPSRMCMFQDHDGRCPTFQERDIRHLLDALLYAFNQADSRELADWARGYRIMLLAALGIEEVAP